VCLEILEDSTTWDQSFTIRHVVESVYSLLCDPNPNEPMQPDVGKLFLRDKKKFESTARALVIKFAMS